MNRPTITPETLRAVLTHRARPKPTAATAPAVWIIAAGIFWHIIILDILFNGVHAYLIP